MALDPLNAKHAGQIAAGTTGRNRGHAFEYALSLQIKDLKDSFYIAEKQTGHLLEGDPATELMCYIRGREKLRAKCKIVYWVGGLATAGKGAELLGSDGLRLRGSKSDIVIIFGTESGDTPIGVSIKTCFNNTPTNDQLFCSTALAFCALMRTHGLEISKQAEIALRMFCGDPGHRPMDVSGATKGRMSTPERWFWEELPARPREELEKLFEFHGHKILSILLRGAYQNDPYPPKYLLHVRHRAKDPKRVPMAIYEISELVELSHRYRKFETKEYMVRKGRFKGDPNIHLAPRFGIVQFQPLGNTQNRNQLQFNLEANYFSKIESYL
jgi:hypothetical protein